MIQGKSVLAIVPARGGSKGVPRKNMRQVAGKPLLAWTINEAKNSKYIDQIVLSSDDADIIALAKSLGCDAPFVRPAELARDEAASIDVVLHAMGMVHGYDIVVMLQPTSPLRKASDIDDCLDFFWGKQANACVSVTQVAQNPNWMFSLSPDKTMLPFAGNGKVIHRRQDLLDLYILNGSIYIAGCEWLRQHKSFLTAETLAYVMAQDRSLDLDTEFDFCFLEYFLELQKKVGIPSSGDKHD